MVWYSVSLSGFDASSFELATPAGTSVEFKNKHGTADLNYIKNYQAFY